MAQRSHTGNTGRLSLNKKVMVGLAFTMIGLMSVIFACSFLIFRYGVEASENNSCAKNIQRTQSALSETLSALDTKLVDWAWRDDSYSFVETRDESYIDTNLMDETLTNLKLNFLVFVNTRDEVVFAKYVDLKTQEEVPFPDSFLARITEPDSPVKPQDSDPKITGILLTPEGPILVASRSILTSYGEGPSHGFILMARYLDDTELSRLSETTRVNVQVLPADGVQPPDFGSASNVLQSGSPMVVQRLSPEKIASYALLRDLDGDSSLILKAETGRDEYRRWKASTRSFLALLLAAGTVFGGVSLFMLRALVLSRLSRLGVAIATVGKSGNLSTRVFEDGQQDELTFLTHEINRMLDSLELSEREGRKSNEQFKLLIENLGEGVLMVNPAGLITFANFAASDIFEAPQNNLVGSPFDDFVVSSNKAEIYEHRTSPSSMQKLTYEIKLCSETALSKFVLVTANPQWDQSGRLLGTLMVLRDITQEKIAARLKATLDAKNEFLSIVSHELKTPLVPVMGYSELLLDGSFGQLPLEAVEPLETIKERVGHLNSLINDLLQFTKIESGTLSLVPRQFKIRETLASLVKSYVDIMRVPADSIGVEGDEFELFTDPDRFRQIIQNLIDNAIKYAEGPPSILIATKLADDKGIITVSDKGIGIPEGHLPFIFDRFYQAESPYTRKHNGVGLGLAIVHDLVRLCGGTITVDSQVGKGTTFTITLPLTMPMSSGELDSNGTDVMVDAAEALKKMRTADRDNQEQFLTTDD
jgi:hypothetical protein